MGNFNTDEKDMCINFGCVEEDCRKCVNMYNFNCKNYESRNTRQAELNKLYEVVGA